MFIQLNNVVVQTVSLQCTLRDIFVCINYLVLTHRNIESSYIQIELLESLSMNQKDDGHQSGQ